MQTYWFAGAKWNVQGDQTARFLSEGIWQNGYEDRLLDLVRSVQPGDPIALKATFTRCHDLPFEAKGRTVSTMSVKALGVVRRNLADGRTLEVDWQRPFDRPKEWYFFVYQPTLWKVQPTDWKRKNLVEWTFEGKLQDYSRFAAEYLGRATR